MIAAGNRNAIRFLSIAAGLWAVLGCCLASGQGNIDFPSQIAPIFTKYCVGCHNDQDREGDLSLQPLVAGRLDDLPPQMVVAEDADRSRLIQVLTGAAEPRMPPEGEPAPSPQEIALLRAWVAHGAPAVRMVGPPASFSPPPLKPAPSEYHQVAAAVGLPAGVALGRLGRIDLYDWTTDQAVNLLQGLDGEVTAMASSPDGSHLAAAVSIPGLAATSLWIDVAQRRIVQSFPGHTDAVYAMAVSPDGKTLATGGYDRRIFVWDISTGQLRHELTGHNGAIYDLDFHPSGIALASASADQTIKIWHVDSGQRLDTLGQAEGELTCVRFAPDGQSVFGAGYDRQIRQWRLLSVERPEVNPMLLARYAHEGSILDLEIVDQQFVLSIADDQTVKLWDIDALRPLGVLHTTRDVPVAIAMAPTDAAAPTVIEIDGRRTRLDRAEWQQRRRAAQRFDRSRRIDSPSAATPTIAADPREFQEQEPNDDPQHAQAIVLPAIITGNIARGVASAADIGDVDVDCFRFQALAGETWIIEVTAAGDKSPLDSLVDILDAQGNPVLRTRLQAVQESYFTFRGKDADTSDDFRLHKWEEMELDEYLYSSGEVTRLWHYPRGPDSGFKVYPGFGARHTFFDTTPLAHALGEPAYIVRPLQPDEQPLPNGLPVFPIYFENDDDPLRRIGSDSRLTFVAPDDGAYVLRVRDARGFGGSDYAYRTEVRRPAPDFKLTLAGTKMSMPVGSGREWSVTAQRIDGFDGEITITLQDVPEGFEVTNPVVIEAGQMRAFGCVFADHPAAGEDQPSDPISIRLVATATINGQTIERTLPQSLEVQLQPDKDKKEVRVRLFTDTTRSEALRVLRLAPGQTASAVVAVERGGTNNRIEFGKDDSGRNLPHGAFVDNIGLNGLLITEDADAREFFITVAPKVQPGRRQFHLRSNTAGNPTSRPVWLEVLPSDSASATPAR
ncbi:MAG: hypothetical protein D6753_04135 [Planctomycetota bacterium]|nr:MAG: hypothetical protein D6753_04135 [Planctomycetota bacterium]